MRFVVVGAGAVGCYYGGLLARAGHRVTLVGRARHVLAMRQHGLTFESGGTVSQVGVDASEHPEASRDADCVLVCVKSPDTAGVAAQLAHRVRTDCVVLSLQNGVDNAERLRAAMQAEVIPVAVYMAAEMAGDGHVLHHGRDELVLGKSPSAASIAAVFTAAGSNASVADNIRQLQWTKLTLNCAYNALAALTQSPCGPLVAQPGMWDVVRDIYRECVAVAGADGVPLPAETWNVIAEVPTTVPDQLPSTAQDIARGRATEIDHLNGYVVARGCALGVATPVNRLLQVLVKQLERAPRPA